MKKLKPKDIRDMLYNYTRLKAEIVAIDFDIYELQAEFQGMNTGDGNEIKPTTPTNRISSMVENEVIRKEEKIAQLKKVKEAKEMEVAKIDNMLTILDNEEREIVKLRYFDKLKVMNVAYKVNLGEERIHQKNRLILSSLAEFLNNRLYPTA